MGVQNFQFCYLCFWNTSFLCSSLMRFFVVQIFLFSRTVCGSLRNLDELIVVPMINSVGLAIVAEANLLCGDFLSEKSCRHKLVVSTSFWSWLLNVSSVLTSKKTHSHNFFGLLICQCVVGYWGSWEYYVFDFFNMFLKYVIFLFVLDAIFVLLMC